MSSREQIKDVLTDYYESLCAGKSAGLSRFFDDTAILISLAGSNAISGAANIDSVFENLLDTWKAIGVSSKISYDRARFTVTDVQENVQLLQTPLTNFKLDGKVFETWNCTYVFCKKDDGWKISLVTFDDKGSAKFAESE